MSKKIIGVIVVIAIAFGVGYFVRQSGDNPATQDYSGTTSNPETSNRSIDLSGQQLTSLPENVLSQTDITSLNVSNNQLTTLPAGIEKLVNLQSLNVENNRIETFPAELSKLTKLREIRANNNRMKSVPDVLSSMTWLQYLDVSGNDIPASEINQLKQKLPDTEIKS